jgi:hypothetical protein
MTATSPGSGAWTVSPSACSAAVIRACCTSPETTPRTNYHFRAGEHGSINVSWARGTHAIAADIMRRLVPTVTGTTAKIRAFDAQEQSDTNSRLALVATILETLAGAETHIPGHCQSIGRSQILVRLPGLRGLHRRRLPRHPRRRR